MQTLAKPSIIAGALALAVAAASLLTGSATATDRVVIVRPGDTLSRIALEHGLTVRQLVALNGLADPDQILAGQRLVIARDEDASATETAPASHLVVSGETLTGLAKRYGTTITAIVAANAIPNPSLIRTGQVLVIPGAAALPAADVPAQPVAAPPAPATPANHLVVSGETLTGIARRYGTTIAAIVAANGISNPSLIRAGRDLVIPTGPPPPTDAGASTGVAAGSMAARVAERADVRRLIEAEAVAQGVPPALALAVAWQESGWQQGVVSSAGAIGIMQLLPASGTWVAQSMLGEHVDLYDAGSNVRAGVRLLRHYLDRYGGDRRLALAAYYQGQTAADRHGVYPASRAYIASILRLEQIFSK